MSHEDFESELNALREALPAVVPTDATKTPSKTADQYYSLDLAKRIIDLSAQGRSLHAISREDEMPCYSTLLRWAKSHPEFSKMLRAVREARALHFEEAAIEAAEAAQGKDADRLKFEAYKWGAEVNDPSIYGKRVNQQIEQTGKVILQVVTGFGPPNPWQTPPKLKDDGTIDKEASAIPVEGKTLDGEPADAAQPEPDAGDVTDTPNPGPTDGILGGVGDCQPGVEAPRAESGHPPEDGSPQSA